MTDCRHTHSRLPLTILESPWVGKFGGQWKEKTYEENQLHVKNKRVHVITKKVPRYSTPHESQHRLSYNRCRHGRLSVTTVIVKPATPKDWQSACNT
eukprot:5681087-Amphidinium_carterae.1